MRTPASFLERSLTLSIRTSTAIQYTNNTSCCSDRGHFLPEEQYLPPRCVKHWVNHLVIMSTESVDRKDNHSISTQ